MSTTKDNDESLAASQAIDGNAANGNTANNNANKPSKRKRIFGKKKGLKTVEYTGFDEQVLQEEAKLTAMKHFTRRRIVYFVVILLVIFSLIAIVVAIVVGIQIQNTTRQGVRPAMNTQINTGNFVSNGGGLISEDLAYMMIFVNEITLNVVSTSSGSILWRKSLPSEATTAGARLTVSNQGVLQIFVNDAMVWEFTDQYVSPNPNAVGTYTLKVVSIYPSTSNSGSIGQVQVINSQDDVVWKNPSFVE